MKMKLKKKTSDLSNLPRFCKEKSCESPLRSDSKDKYCAQCKAKIDAKNQETLGFVVLSVVGICVVSIKKIKPGRIVAAVIKQIF